ncbi:MAG: hypothetical protein O7G29_14170 [Acidobacteria bacterium]|nr:hypothetical protein [Acidobacteriota bacterium]
MAAKRLTLLLYGADRKLWHSGNATLRVTRFDSEEIEALLIRTEEGTRRRKNVPLTGSVIEVSLDLKFDAGQVYGLQVKAPWHRAIGQLISRETFLRQEGGEMIEQEDAILRLMLMPRTPKSSDLDDGYRKLVKQGSPFVQPDTGIREDEYLNLASDAEKMAFLNIEAKLRATRVGGAPLLSCVTGLRHISVDRLFLMMRAKAKKMVEKSGFFTSAPGHGKPSEAPYLPSHPDSWKHQMFPAGNVQLSFAHSAEKWPKASGSRSFSVDVDIDLERGIKHWGEWLDNNVLHPGKKTDQTFVYALLYSENILPVYTLDPIEVS